MKLLFLDLDGVLCLDNQAGSRFKKPNKFDCDLFDKGAVQVLNEILIENRDIEIVVSSDWKDHLSLPLMREMFLWQGVVKEPIGFTPRLEGISTQLEEWRSREILTWLKHHNSFSENWVAVDDLNLEPFLGTLNFVHSKKPGTEGLKQTGMKEKVNRLFNEYKK